MIQNTRPYARPLQTQWVKHDFLAAIPYRRLIFFEKILFIYEHQLSNLFSCKGFVIIIVFFAFPFFLKLFN